MIECVLELGKVEFNLNSKFHQLCGLGRSPPLSESSLVH